MVHLEPLCSCFEIILHHTPLQGLNNSLSSPIYVDLVKLSLINLKKYEVLLFPQYFSLILYEFPPPSHFFSSTHQSTTFPSSSSPQHTPFISHSPFSFFSSFPLSIIPLHSLLSFLSKQGVIKEIPNFVPTRSHQSRISVEVLSFLSFCMIDHPSPKISCS